MTLQNLSSPSTDFSVSEKSQPEVASKNAARNRAWLLGLLLVAAVIFAYQPAWRAGFIWDDDEYVTHNPLLTAPDGFSRIWFSTDSPSQYFPLVYTTFRLEHALWGLNPAGYHWVNILLHAVNALLVWRLLLRLSIPGAWLAAAIFALHPVQVESVAWVTELKNVESLFFSLLTLLAWVNFTEERPRSPGRWYAFALVCYALALFSKTTACTLPAALLLILWLQKKPIARARLAQITPFVLLGFAMGLLTMWWERHHQGTHGNDFGLNLLDRTLIASRAVWFYLGKLLWPVNLTFSYPHWTIDSSQPLAYVGLAAGIGWGGAVYFARRWIGRSAEVATTFYVATLSPLLGFVMLYTFRYTFVADHYQYVALLGPVALVAAGISVLVKNPLVRPLLSGVLLAGLATLTWRQSRMYVDLETLWQTTLARNPDSDIAHNNLSVLLFGKGRMDEALEHAQKALALPPRGPDDALAHVNLGNALLQKSQRDEAIGHYRAAIEIQPGYADAHNNLGGALVQKGEPDEAAAEFQKTLEIRPKHANAHYNLGNVLLGKGRGEEAIAHFRSALIIEPNDADVHNDLGTALLLAGRVDEAAAHFESALKIRPGLVQAQTNLGFALLQKGQPREAIAHYRAALSFQPDNARTLSSLAWVLATNPDSAVRNGAQAFALAQRANDLSANRDPLVLHALAAAAAESARFGEAVAIAQRALALAETSADPALAELLRKQIALYRSGQPFRDGVQP